MLSAESPEGDSAYIVKYFRLWPEVLSFKFYFFSLSAESPEGDSACIGMQFLLLKN
jgi:hypothetical protein